MLLHFLTLVTTLLPADDASGELKKHQGRWMVTSFLRNGEPTPEELVAEIERVVTDDHVVWKRQGKNFAGTSMVLDPSKSPRTIDLIPDGGRSRGKTVLGIYKFEGDVLTICVADADQPRPTTFDAPKGSPRTLMTFRHKPVR